MAEGIKYFPLSCSDDDRYDFIEAEFGLKGYAIVVKLHKRIFKGLGYYCEWNDRVSKLFAKNACCGAAPALVQEVVKTAIAENIFDRTMFEKYGILTSTDIQKTFYNVAKRRDVVFDVPEYVLFVPPALSSAADISAGNVCNQGQNVCNAPQKKSEEKKSELKGRQLTPENRKILADEYGKSVVEAYEQKFQRWRASKNALNADPFLTISKWLSEDKPQKSDTGNSSFSAADVEKLVSDKYRRLDNDKT